MYIPLNLNAVSNHQLQHIHAQNLVNIYNINQRDKSNRFCAKYVKYLPKQFRIN